MFQCFLCRWPDYYYLNSLDGGVHLRIMLCWGRASRAQNLCPYPKSSILTLLLTCLRKPPGKISDFPSRLYCLHHGEKSLPLEAVDVEGRTWIVRFRCDAWRDDIGALFVSFLGLDLLVASLDHAAVAPKDLNNLTPKLALTLHAHENGIFVCSEGRIGFCRCGRSWSRYCWRAALLVFE